MYKFKIKLLNNKGKLFSTKTELLNLKFTLALARLDVVSSRSVLNGSIFSDDIQIYIQHLIPLLPNIRKLSVRAKTRKFWRP